MMHMTFYWGTKVTLLVDSWRTDSRFDYFLTLLACLMVSAFYQYLENHRIRLKLMYSAKPIPAAAQIQTPLLEPKLTGSRAKLGVKFAGAVMFGVNSAIGYLLMLAIMSFNGGVFVAVVLGLAVGHFFFRSGDEEVSLLVENACGCV